MHMKHNDDFIEDQIEAEQEYYRLVDEVEKLKKENKELKEWNSNLVKELDSGERISRLLEERDYLKECLQKQTKFLENSLYEKAVEIRTLKEQQDLLVGFVQEFADEGCHYKDNCPDFGSNHYKCYSCKANKLLENISKE